MPDIPADVLLVEDNIIIAMALEENFLDLGVSSVRVARSVADAMAAIDQRVPDCALLDIELKDETSRLIAVRLQSLGVRFAFLSGHGTNVSLGREFDGIRHINKPFAPDELAEWLRGR